ncbi:MAG: alpha/beta fold hydrolase [Myxococcales bacterium]|nr:alpha/beta fold hydrolase [Myxococcales bacterium]
MSFVGPSDRPSDAASRYVTLEPGGRRLSLVAEGPDGPLPFVLVHGIPGSARDFRWLTPHLAPQVATLRLDLPGFGDSPLAAGTGLGVADRADVVLDAMGALGVRRAVLVGHSFGGVVAAEAAVRAPERFAGLALIASPGPRSHRGHPRRTARLVTRVSRLPFLAALLRAPLRRGFRAAGFPAHFSDEQLWLSMALVDAFDLAAHAQNLRALLLPTAVYGCRDDAMVEESILTAVGDMVPAGPRVIFHTGGHNPQKTQAAALAASLLAFRRGVLSEVDAP